MSLGKIALGALATTALAWVFTGPFGLGKNCPATATAPVTTVPVPEANITVPAAPEAVATCQSDVNALLTGKTINFETSSAKIAAVSLPLVDEIATKLKGCAGTAVEVGGHTDARGGDAANMALSEARAKSVVAELTAKGVAASQISAKGYGETKPLDTSNTAAGDAKNRRIEFNVSAAGASGAETAAPSNTAG